MSSLSFLKVYFISTNQNYLIPKKYWGYVPNWNAVGLAFVVPQVYYSIAMAVGSSVNYFWMLRNPAGYDMYMFAISAGMLAGEGLGGVFQALLAIIGVDGGSKSLRMLHFIHNLIFLLRIRHRDWLPGNGILWLRVALLWLFVHGSVQVLYTYKISLLIYYP